MNNPNKPQVNRLHTLWRALKSKKYRIITKGIIFFIFALLFLIIGLSLLSVHDMPGEFGASGFKVLKLVGLSGIWNYAWDQIAIWRAGVVFAIILTPVFTILSLFITSYYFAFKKTAN